MKALINKVLGTFGLSLVKVGSLNKLKNDLDFQSELIHANIGRDVLEKDTIETIVFSMDRALQLHALLSSYYEKVKHTGRVNILYRSTSSEHELAYQEVFRLFGHAKLNIVRQESKETFKKQLIAILEQIKTMNIFYLVDDIVFTEDLDLRDCTRFDTRDYVFSLRMGKNITSSYTAGKDELAQPEFVKMEDKILWSWKRISAESDWEYPLSVDGHIYSTREMVLLTQNLNFTSPNTYEPALYKFAEYFKNRKGISYLKSKLVNLPINKVQVDKNNTNRFGNVHQDFLLGKWNEGMQMDYKKLYGFNNNDAHQEIEIDLIPRK